ELRDVTPLGDDQLTLLGRLGAGRSGQSRRQGSGGAGDAGRLQQLATGETAHGGTSRKSAAICGHSGPAVKGARRGATLRGIMRGADVVVIGGGVNGASTAFHLTALGVRDVLLVERRHPGAGATGKSGALGRMHHPNGAGSRPPAEAPKSLRG